MLTTFNQQPGSGFMAVLQVGNEPGIFLYIHTTVSQCYVPPSQIAFFVWSTLYSYLLYPYTCCCLGCDVYPLDRKFTLWLEREEKEERYRVFGVGTYQLASEDQVNQEKRWILERLDKWAVAKFNSGFVSMREGCAAIVVPFTPRYTDVVMEDKS